MSTMTRLSSTGTLAETGPTMTMIRWVAFSTILRKEIDRFLRIWPQTLLPPAITMTLYFVVFGQLIGSRVGEVNGLPYMAFVVPGVILMAVINSTYANVSSSFFSAKFQKHIEEILVAPVPNVLMMLGFVLGAVARGLVVGVIVTIIALFFTELSVHSWPVAISVVILTAFLFSIGGFINAMVARKFDDVSIFPTFVLMPLTYLGGVFYSTAMIPEFWRGISQINPILYMVNAFRYGILGEGASDVGLMWAYLIICGFVIGLFAIATVMLNRGVGLRS